MAETKKLLFVDTNILLDFYRGGTDAAISLLRHLEKISDRVIMASQVQMEFLKNRQNTLRKSVEQLLLQGIPRPALFAEKTIFKELQTKIDEARKIGTELKREFDDMLLHPEKDEVYRVAQILFTKSGFMLRERTKEFGEIESRAWRRFMRNCPPRKKDDQTVGDAINWEWIIDAAHKSGADVVIVSRDSDYGKEAYGNERLLNDWLLHEFHDRVHPERKVQLFEKLSDALTLFEVSVTAEERKAEETIIEVRTIESTEQVFAPFVKQMSPEMVRFIQELQERNQSTSSNSGPSSSSSQNASSSSSSSSTSSGP
jgi:predicted nucleic acid-binding protein